MARLPQLPEAVRRSVARQIGERMPAPGPSLLREETILGESFPIFMLPLNTLQAGPAQGGPRPVFTGRWHHQIERMGAVPMFARSLETTSAEDQEVEEVVQAETAQQIAETIRWIDEQASDQIDDDAVAVLLLAPAFYLSAFWLMHAGRVDAPERDKVVVIERPERLASTLEPRVLYPLPTFLRLLAEQSASSGLPGEPPPPR